MKVINIIGDNYTGHTDRQRIACRAIIIEDGKMLLSYEQKSNIYMIPGGGLEPKEKEEDCVVREVLEETGLIIEPSKCVLEINEFYSNAKFISRYFLGKIKGEAERHLTEREKEVEMVPVWLEINDVVEIFSKYNDYKDSNEMQAGLYKREITAIKELLNLDLLIK